MTTTISWYRHEPVQIQTISELDKWLDLLSEEGSASVPFSVSMSISEEESNLMLTLGRKESHMEYYAAKEIPMISGSRGPWDSDELIHFLLNGEYSEVKKRFFVPIEIARESARIYFLTRKRPQNVIWGL